MFWIICLSISLVEVNLAFQNFVTHLYLSLHYFLGFVLLMNNLCNVVWTLLVTALWRLLVMSLTIILSLFFTTLTIFLYLMSGCSTAVEKTCGFFLPSFFFPWGAFLFGHIALFTMPNGLSSIFHISSASKWLALLPQTALWSSHC